MSLLTVLFTHLPAPAVQRQLRFLRELCPGSSFAVCHGGPKEAFLALEEPDALWLEDPSLRGDVFDQQISEVYIRSYESFVRDRPSVEFIYVIEYDHAVLRRDFEDALLDLTQRAEAGLYAKAACHRNDSNWIHYLHNRDHAEYNRFLSRISTRDHPKERLGCLGDGMLFTRAALRAFAEVPGLPAVYGEALIPTTVYHLGYDVIDIDRLGDLYSGVRWRPAFTVEEARRAVSQGQFFLHPFKEADALPAIVGRGR